MNIRLILASTLVGLSLVACNGGGSSPTPIGTTGGPTPTPTSAPVTKSVTPTLSTSGSTTTLTPNLSNSTLGALGLSGQPTISGPSGLTLPSVPSVTYTNEQPASIATFSHGHRTTKQVISSTVPGATGLVFTYFTAPSAFTVPAGASATFTYPFATTPVGNYNLAFFDGTQWNADTLDSGVISGNTVSITTTPLAADLNLVSGTTYAVALYVTTTASPTPTPSTTPTVAPTVAPTTTPTAGPTFAPVNGSASVSYQSTERSTATIGGNSAQIVLPQANHTATLNYTLSATPPSNVVALDSSFGTNINWVDGYAMVTPSRTITFASGSVFTGSITAAGIPSGSYHVAYSNDGMNWVPGFGTSSVSGANGSTSTETLTLTNTQTISLTGGTNYYLAIYQ